MTTFHYSQLILIVLLTASLNFAAEYLRNVDCSAYLYYVHIDKEYSRYYPYVVNIYRCHGANYGDFNPLFQACVPTHLNFINITVIDIFSLKPLSIAIQNDTSCSVQCISVAKSFTSYSPCGSDSCRCNCNNSKQNRQCDKPKVWSSIDCDCVCPMAQQDCSAERVWNSESCQCTCKQQLFSQCFMLNKTLDLTSCQCTKANLECDKKSFSYSIVVLILGAEALIVLLFNLFLYRHLKMFSCPKSKCFNLKSKKKLDLCFKK